LGNGSVTIPPAAITAAATATATTAVTTTTAAGTRGAFFTRASDVDRQGTAADFFPVQRGERGLGFLIRGHGDETKSAGTARGAIHHQVRFDNRAVGGKGVLQFIFRDREGEVAHEQFIVITHVMSSVPTELLFPRPVPDFGFKIITELSSPEDLPYLESDKLSNRDIKVTDCGGMTNYILNYFSTFPDAQTNTLISGNFRVIFAN
jgi:hypothetical protein